MGFFICLNNSKFKVRNHAKLETDLIRRHEFQLITDSDYNRLMQLVVKSITEGGESFCKRIEEGVSFGIMASTLVGNSIQTNTVLILTTKDAIEEIQTIEDIRAILAFSYEDDEDNTADINALCSNQLTKSRGGGLLISPFIDVCRQNGVSAINLYSSEDGVQFYRKKGFVDAGDERFPNKMTLRLVGGRGGKTKKRRNRKYTRS